MSSQATYAYVDGFNLYYRALKGTPHKWLDLHALLRLVFPKNRFDCIRYFTARVKALPHDRNQPLRQEIYLRALRSTSNIKIHFGQFTTHEVRLPLASTVSSNKVRYAKVLKSEEKGSDVNLATYLIHDGHLGRYETAIVITNDSDLVQPIRIIRENLGLAVGVLNPCNQPATGLRNAASFYRVLRNSAPPKCQFPDTMRDSRGEFFKPPEW